MVASDTLVGLVGAGILLVALVGVFVFESKQTTADEELAASVYPVEANPGTLQYAAATGVTLPTGQCATPPCQPQRVKLTMTILGAPPLPTGSGLKYHAFLTNGAQTLAFGSFTHQDANYRIDTPQRDIPTGVSYNRLIVTMESASQPARPSGPELYTQDVQQPAADQSRDVNVGGSTDVKWPGEATGRAQLAETDQGLQVDLTLSGARNWTGFVYRAWLHIDDLDTLGYTFLGTFENGTVSVTITGAQIDDYDHLIVTLEAANTPENEGGTEAGGPAVFVARLGPDEILDAR